MPTRWRDQQPGNLLDLVLTDFEDSILNLESTNHLGNSDHLSLEFLINRITENYVNGIEKRNFYRADYVSANQKISNVLIICDLSVLTFGRVQFSGLSR